MKTKKTPSELLLMLLVLIILVVVILTLPEQRPRTEIIDDEEGERTFEELTRRERRDIVDREEQINNDKYYMSTAKGTLNNEFCQYIISQEKRQECYNIVQ